MTATTATEIERRRGRPLQARTMVAALAQAARRLQVAEGHVATAMRWPSTRYRDDPVAFAHEVLGIALWAKQVEVIEAIRDNLRVAVASGHKIGKSMSAAIVALWFYASFEDARVVMSSTTSRQVDQILWRELRMLFARSGRCVDCKAGEPRGPRPCPHSHLLDGDMHELARSGLKAPDFREVVGFTAREAEAVAGVSGKNLLYLIDEASGVPEAVFQAIEGNRAGGARIALFSNPTRTEGEFFEAFDSKDYKRITISSEESPNVVEGRDVIPGLATRGWVEEKKREWGVDSPIYKVRVQGKFVIGEEGKILSLHAIAAAEARWPDAPADGRLYVGLDPAGPGGAGAESVFAPRRGGKVVELVAKRGLGEEGHLVELLGILARHRKGREPPPVVVVDREGMIGARVYGFLRAHLDGRPDAFELVGVRSSELADGGAQIREHDRVRDKLWANLEQWLRDVEAGGEGGAIPEDTRLAKELNAPEWKPDLRKRLKATSKEDLKKKLGRSPDRADAVCLAVWEPAAMTSKRTAEREAPQEEPAEISPYDGEDVGSAGGLSPYDS